MNPAAPGHTYVIAEAGVNHNGSVELALELVDIAAKAGADAVKFQTFKAANLVSMTAPKAAYQRKTTTRDESQFEMLRKLELSEKAHRLISARCRRRGIDFLSSPFDVESANFLVREFDMPLVKIPSGELTNAPLLLAAARTRRRIIVSTGMATLQDIRSALGVLAFGYCVRSGTPSPAAFRRAWLSPEGKLALSRKVALLHCTTEYPAPIGEVNLRAMDTMREAFGLKVGFSDHTQGIVVPLAAVARGATIIEKHFTSDSSLPGPDHRASLEPGELTSMISGIRAVELALGSRKKAPTKAELENLAICRKSLVTTRAIRKGEEFTARNLAVKRPGTGVSPMNFWNWLGRSAQRDYLPDELV